MVNNPENPIAIQTERRCKVYDHLCNCEPCTRERNSRKPEQVDVARLAAKQLRTVRLLNNDFEENEAIEIITASLKKEKS